MRYTYTSFGISTITLVINIKTKFFKLDFKIYTNNEIVFIKPSNKISKENLKI